MVEEALASKENTDTVKSAPPSRKRLVLDEGVYIPPAKRRQMEKQAQEEAAEELVDRNIQLETWQTQKRIIHGTINRLNTYTIKPLIHELFQKVNILRMRGVLAKAVLQAALSSPYAAVYASLVAVINSKLPEVGELVVHRCILQFRQAFRRKNKILTVAACTFLGHLFHQAVVHELLILQILMLFLENGTADAIGVAVQLLETTGAALLEVSPAGVRAVTEQLRSILQEAKLSKKVQFQIQHVLKLRQTKFASVGAPVPEELDLVEADDQITFEVSLDDEDIQRQDELNSFRPNNEYKEQEDTWNQIRAEILGEGDSETDSDGEAETDDDESEDEDGEEPQKKEGTTEAPENSSALAVANQGTVVVEDLTENELVHLRRTIYLTIMSSATFEECAHKLAKVSIPDGKEEELVNMIIECCSQERTFLRYYGLIGARFCLMADRWLDAFKAAFATQYNTIHRLETNKLRNVAKFFAHLLHSDSMPWSVLEVIHINEVETTSSSRIFIKILVQEIAEAIGIAKLKARFETEEPEQLVWYKGMFPMDNVRKTRYSINFFTSIGLGALTDVMRQFLKDAPKIVLEQKPQEEEDSDDESTSSSSSSGSSSSSSSLSSSSLSSSSRSSYSSRSRSRSRNRRRRRRTSSSSSSSSSSNSSSSSTSSDSRSRRRRRSSSRRRESVNEKERHAGRDADDRDRSRS